MGDVENNWSDDWFEDFEELSPDVGEGGGVATTRCRCFSSMASKIPSGRDSIEKKGVRN